MLKGRKVEANTAFGDNMHLLLEPIEGFYEIAYNDGIGIPTIGNGTALVARNGQGVWSRLTDSFLKTVFPTIEFTAGDKNRLRNAADVLNLRDNERRKQKTISKELKDVVGEDGTTKYEQLVGKVDAKIATLTEQSIQVSAEADRLLSEGNTSAASDKSAISHSLAVEANELKVKKNNLTHSREQESNYIDELKVLFPSTTEIKSAIKDDSLDDINVLSIQVSKDQAKYALLHEVDKKRTSLKNILGGDLYSGLENTYEEYTLVSLLFNGVPLRYKDKKGKLPILVSLNTHSGSFEHPEPLTHCPL